MQCNEMGTSRGTTYDFMGEGGGGEEDLNEPDNFLRPIFGAGKSFCRPFGTDDIF